VTEQRASDIPRLPAVLITRAPGAGKSAVAKEVHELLRLAGVRNAMIDLDALGNVFPEADLPFNSQLILSNLAASWPNYRSLHLERLVLARILLSDDEVDAYRFAIPEMQLSVCRLEAPDEELRRRLRAREPGVSQEFLLRVAPRLAEELRNNAVENFVVDNGPGRSLTAVGRELLQRLTWPAPPESPEVEA
jgi:hypothetical protein